MEATFMTALHIETVRHLKNIAIPLSQNQRKSLILTGKNGSGKTSVLLALKNFLEYTVLPNFELKDQTNKSVSFSDNDFIQTGIIKKEQFEINQKRRILAYYKKFHELFAVDKTIAKFTSVDDLCKKYQNGDYILAYYEDCREIEVQISKNIEKVNLKNVYTMTERPSQQLVKYLVNLKTTEAFAQTNNNPGRAKEIREWFSRFEQVLQSIYEDDSLVLDFNIDTFAFTIRQKNREPFDFNTMSMGYAAVFDIIGDLIMRMESKHRYDLEGLVLIDEIETHLHVGLQKKIVPILMKLFPNIQFVLTTHSPFILNSTPNAVIYDLENATLAADGLTNLPYEGIVEGYFGADLLSQELRQKFTEYQALVEKTDLTDADFARAAELELYLDEVPDYLALNLSAEYGRLKLAFSRRG